MGLKYEMPNEFHLKSDMYGGDIPVRGMRFKPLDYDRDGFVMEMTVLAAHSRQYNYPQHGVLVLLKHKEYRSDYKLFCSYSDDALKFDQSQSWGKDYEVVFDFLVDSHDRDLQADLEHNAKEHDEDLFALKEKMRSLYDLLYYSRGAQTINRDQLKAVLGYEE